MQENCTPQPWEPTLLTFFPVKQSSGKTRRRAALSCPWHSNGYARRKWFASSIPNGTTFGQSGGGSGNSVGTMDCSVIAVIIVVNMVGVDCGLDDGLGLKSVDSPCKGEGSYDSMGCMYCTMFPMCRCEGKCHAASLDG